MKHGFVKVGAVGTGIVVADTARNTALIKQKMSDADALGLNLAVFPELCITGYTCGDLFYTETLLLSAERSLEVLREFSKGKYPLYLIGVPLRFRGKIYNCAAAIHNGRILGVQAKRFLPNYGEFYEMRQFTSGDSIPEDAEIIVGGVSVPFGTDLLFRHDTKPGFCVGVELCEDLWAGTAPYEDICTGGAVIVANLSASDEIVGKASYRRTLVTAASGKLNCAYIYCSSGPQESTQDMVFSGHRIIAENGNIIAEAKPFAGSGITVTEIDTDKLLFERRRNTSFRPSHKVMREIIFSQEQRTTELTRAYSSTPFVPADSGELNERSEAILQIQSQGLAKRLHHAHAKTAVIGISGGLDSTLAVLVAIRAMAILGRPNSDVLCVTMPCFGTTQRTKSNAVKLCELLGVTLKEVNITKSVLQHFEDIGQSDKCYDVTYENSQARERTQVLMDIANMTGGIVVGTGDLSELALGWATYNGDHMSMYGVNSSVPKTLVRYVVRHEAMAKGGELADVLYDILDTPVSPELLPADEQGEIAQKTEDLVGPYELHDFFLYHMMRTGAGPGKLYRLAVKAFEGVHTPETIIHWLSIFTKRFFVQQFKRSCVPDGPKVGTVSLSPRGDWRMPSDASSEVWLKEIEEIKEKM